MEAYVGEIITHKYRYSQDRTKAVTTKTDLKVHCLGMS